MTDLIDTTEMYLRTIYELIEDGVQPLRARIAEQLGHSGPTVSQTVARMERDGLVVLGSDRTLTLTPLGETIATRVMRKHRLAERLLTDVIGLDLAHVHEEACKWEHVMSERVELRVMELLGDPQVSPYGNPIPGLDELGKVPNPGPEVPVSVNLAAKSGPVTVTLVRIGEIPQAHEGFLDLILEIGLLPGVTCQVEPVSGGVKITASGGSAVISDEAARHVFVL